MILSKSFILKINRKILSLEKEKENFKKNLNNYNSELQSPGFAKGREIKINVLPEAQREMKKDSIKTIDLKMGILKKVLSGDLDISNKSIAKKNNRVKDIIKEMRVLVSELSDAETAKKLLDL